MCIVLFFQLTNKYLTKGVLISFKLVKLIKNYDFHFLNSLFIYFLALIPIHHMEAHALTARLTHPVSSQKVILRTVK